MRIVTQNTVGAFLEAVEEEYFDKDKLIEALAQWLGGYEIEKMIKHYEWFVPGVNEPFNEPDLEEI